MKQKSILRLTVLFAAVLTVVNAGAQPNTQRLKRLFNNYYEETKALSPINATFSGDHRYDGKLANEGAADYLAARHRFNTKYLAQLNQYNRLSLSVADRISYDVLKELINMDLESELYHLEYLPINQFSSIPLLMGQLGSGSSAQPFYTVQDYEKWLDRIEAFRLYTDTIIANMRKGIKKHVVLPKDLVIKMIPQMEDLAQTDSAKSIFYGPLRQMPPAFSAADKLRLKSAYEQVLHSTLFPAYQRLADFLKTEYLPNAADAPGLSALPGGSKLYAYYTRYYTTTTLTPEQIYQTGLNEVARITASMERLKAQTGFNGSLADFFNFLKTDRQFMPFNTADKVLQAYRDIYQKIQPHLPELFNIQPKAKFEIRRVESFREASQNGPSYSIGSLDGSRPGIFYVPIPDATKINVTFLGLEATFIHEAIPGHHYQIALQQENTALPLFRRQISFSAFTEGWGLYVESLGKRLGCYTDPYQQMGALNNEIHRAIRLVVDVGIHTGKMTKKQAISYMMAHESISPEDALLSAERYMAIPGQALCYKIGELEITRIREQLKRSLGNKFNIVSFHSALLREGDMPLNVLDTYLKEWGNNYRKAKR
jgi:uncharacterized protein (DUF885 family)